MFFTGREDSYLCAAFSRNQHIKAYWSRLKKLHLNWYIDYFSHMVSRECSDHIQKHIKNICWFAF